MEITIRVCNVCKDPAKTTDRYDITQGKRAGYMDLCAQDQEKLEAVLPPRTGRLPKHIMEHKANQLGSEPGAKSTRSRRTTRKTATTRKRSAAKKVPATRVVDPDKIVKTGAQPAATGA